MNRIHFVLLLIISALTACKIDSSNDLSFSILPTEEIIRLPIDFRTSNVSAHFSYFQTRDREYLFNLNGNLNEIQIFDLGEENLIKRVEFQIEGPEGVGQIESFFVQSFDSIYLFPRNKYSVYLADTSSNVLKKIDYNPPTGYVSPKLPSAYFSVQSGTSNNKILTKTFFEGNYTYLDKDELSSKHLTYLLDLKDGGLELTKHTFPQDYWENGKRHYEFSLTSNEDHIVYSFFADDKVYYTSKSNEKLQSKEVRSSLSSGSFDNIPLDGTRADRANYFATTSHYGNIFYDPYRDLFIRFYYPDYEKQESDEIRDLIRFSGSFTIMLLDANFNMLDEMIIRDNKLYNPSNVFIGKKGLYLSINNPKNPENREEYLSFRLLEILK